MVYPFLSFKIQKKGQITIQSWAMALNEKLTLKHATCFLDHSIPELLL